MTDARPDTLELAACAARLAEDSKAEDILLLDMQGVCSFTDYFVLASCASAPQLRAVGRRIERRLRDLDQRPLASAGFEGESWVVLDYGDFVVHLFHHDARDYYRIERLWGDSRECDWQAPELNSLPLEAPQPADESA